jgi:hypothetical protein
MSLNLKPESVGAKDTVMILTIHLTADQEERLRREALSRGIDEDMLAQQLQGRALSDIGEGTMPPWRPRVLGLHAGQVSIADDFDAPLPDGFTWR